MSKLHDEANINDRAMTILDIFFENSRANKQCASPVSQWENALWLMPNFTSMQLNLTKSHCIYLAIRQGFSPSRMTANNEISPIKFCYNTRFTLPKPSQSSRSIL